LLALMAIGGNALGRLFLGREVLVSGWMYAVMAIGLVLETHHGAHSNLYVTKNHIPFLVPSLVSGALILGAGSLLAPEFGLLAVILVQFLVQLAFNNWYPVWLVCQDLGWTIPGYVRACARGIWRMPAPIRN